MTSTNQSHPSPRMFFILSGVLILFIIISGYGLYRHEAAAVQTEKYNELKAIANLKIQQIVAWRLEREADARMFSTGIIRKDVLEWLTSTDGLPGLRAAITDRFQMLYKYYDYNNIILAGTDGRVLISLDPKIAELEPQIREVTRRAVSSRDVVFGDFFQCSHHKRIHLDVAAPIPGEDNLPVAVLILRTDPAKTLYPLIQTWPTPSQSAETLIVRRDGDNVLFLNTLRHRPDPPLTIRIPLSKADVPAVRAAFGQTGLFQGQDYRGTDVLADIRAVPGSPWFMIAKVDTDEILAEIQTDGIIIGLLTLMLTLLAGTSAGYLYKHQGKRAFQALYQAESALRNAEKEYKTTLYSIGDAVITTDVNGRIRQMNPVAEQLTGWAEADAKGQPSEAVFRIISEATGETVSSPVQKVLEKGLIVGLANHTLLIAEDGTQTPIADSGAPIRDESGNTTGVVLVFRDQSKERFAEASLRQEKSFSDTMINSLPGIFYLFNEEGHFLRWNKNFEVVSGYSSEEMKKMHPLNFFSGEEKKRIEETIQEALIKGESHVEANFISKEGGSVPYYFTAFRFVSDNRPYLVGMGIDISEAKRSEADLLTLSAHQQALLSAIPDIIMQVDINKVYTWANQPGYDFFGKDVIGKKADFYFEGDQPVYDMVQPLFNGNENIIYLESWQRRKDGQKRLLAWWCRVLKDRQGNATGALSTARDITDHRTMEDQLRQAQKMDSVGRLAGGVAHDFNNMLMVIITYTEMVIERVNPEQPIFKDLQEVLNAAKRSANLTRQLLAFARKQTIRPVVLDVNDTISSMLKLLRQLIGEDIDLAWQPGLETWPVKMDPSQIDQILANLLVNAKDAIGGVGSITIETDNVEFDDAYCAHNVGFVPGKYVMIAVSDTGAGMDRQTLDSLFEPFFTTKEIGKGTGLGLATVYGIVKQNNGFINVYSEPGDGTVFKIYFPRTEDGLAEIPAAKAGKNLRGTETVMIVEDEESILNLGASILKQYGYTVISAQSPDDALALAKQFDGEIHLLVTDVVMPRMHGKDLMEKLRDTRPEIKSIFMSGYTANAIAHHGVLESGVQFLQKPFSVKALAQKVREVLDGE